jgi:hypothetical protein
MRVQSKFLAVNTKSVWDTTADFNKWTLRYLNEAQELNKKEYLFPNQTREQTFLQYTLRQK